MIDHVTLRVGDFGASRRFYTEALAPLGYEVLHEFPGALGMGRDGKPDFWIASADYRTAGTHVAFAADQRTAVDAFYRSAIQAGGKDNGAPGVREEYHPQYYGAFVFDPDGNNIEAVCHKAEP